MRKTSFTETFLQAFDALITNELSLARGLQPNIDLYFFLLGLTLLEESAAVAALTELESRDSRLKENSCWTTAIKWDDLLLEVKEKQPVSADVFEALKRGFSQCGFEPKEGELPADVRLIAADLAACIPLRLIKLAYLLNGFGSFSIKTLIPLAHHRRKLLDMLEASSLEADRKILLRRYWNLMGYQEGVKQRTLENMKVELAYRLNIKEAKVTEFGDLAASMLKRKMIKQIFFDLRMCEQIFAAVAEAKSRLISEAGQAQVVESVLFLSDAAVKQVDPTQDPMSLRQELLNLLVRKGVLAAEERLKFYLVKYPNLLNPLRYQILMAAEDEAVKDSRVLQVVKDNDFRVAAEFAGIKKEVTALFLARIADDKPGSSKIKAAFQTLPLYKETIEKFCPISLELYRQNELVGSLKIFRVCQGGISTSISMIGTSARFSRIHLVRLCDLVLHGRFDQQTKTRVISCQGDFEEFRRCCVQLDMTIKEFLLQPVIQLFCDKYPQQAASLQKLQVSDFLNIK